MEEKLNKTIQELTEKLKATELKITKQEEEAQSNSTTVIYQTKPEKSYRNYEKAMMFMIGLKLQRVTSAD